MFWHGTRSYPSKFRFSFENKSFSRSQIRIWIKKLSKCVTAARRFCDGFDLIDVETNKCHSLFYMYVKPKQQHHARNGWCCWKLFLGQLCSPKVGGTWTNENNQSRCGMNKKASTNEWTSEWTYILHVCQMSKLTDSLFVGDWRPRPFVTS